MRMSPWRCTLPFVSVLLAGFACAQTTVTLVDELLPGAVAGDRGPYLTRLVDDLSEPIADAEVFLVAESNTPIAGEFWFSHSGRSDADGFVRIPRPNGDRGWHWQVMRHATRGVAVRSSYVEPVWRIGRTFDVPLEILGPDGQPAAGASVGFCGGCGHSPDVATAVADANGFAVLRGIDPKQDIRDLYVQHPGLHFYYDSVDWRPGEPPMVVRCGYGPAQTGRVVDHEGEPVAGAFVRGGGKHRGPWGRTAADGAFTILGAEPDESPFQVVTQDGREVWFSVDAADPYPITMRLPDPAGDDPTEGVVEVATNVPRETATRRVRLVVDGAPADGVDVAVWFVGRPEAANEVQDHIDVPIGAPFLLTLDLVGSKVYGTERRHAFADGAAVSDPLVVEWRPDARVTGRAVDAAGRPIATRLRWPFGDGRGEPDPAVDANDGSFDLSIGSGAGWRLLEIAPQADGERARLVWVTVPRHGGRVDLGDVEVGGPSRLTVLGADGAPLAAATVGWARPGWQEVGETLDWPLDARGGWCGPDLREGDAIVVWRAGAVPFRRVLEGAGPWRLVVPDGALDLELVDAAGAPLAGTVVVGDHHETAKDGRFALRGLPAGALRLHIGAPGHRSAIVDAAIGANADVERVRVVLPRRD